MSSSSAADPAPTCRMGQPALATTGLRFDHEDSVRKRSVAGKMVDDLARARHVKNDFVAGRKGPVVERNNKLSSLFQLQRLLRAIRNRGIRRPPNWAVSARENQRPIPTAAPKADPPPGSNYRHPSIGLGERLGIYWISTLACGKPIARRDAEVPMTGSGTRPRAKCLVCWWSENLLPDAAGIPSSGPMIPVVLHLDQRRAASCLPSTPRAISFSLADGVCSFRAIKRFIAFKSSVDCDGRTTRDCMPRCCEIYFGYGIDRRVVAGGSAAAAAIRGLGFQATSH